MGVKINALVDDVKKVVSFQDLLGKRIAIDAFNTLYQFLAIIRGMDGTPLKDLHGNVTSHLSGIYNRTINLIEEGIKPIFVFDGPPNPLKAAEIKHRREVREEATKKMAEAQDSEDFEEAAKYAQGTSKLNAEMIDESKELLKAIGVPVIDAAQDGEAQAAFLVEKELAWAVGSQDYDALLFGANRVIRNLSQNRIRKMRNTTVKVEIEYIGLQKVLETAALTRVQLVDIGILVGLDFFPGIEGVGAKTALSLIKEYGSLDTMIAQKVEVRKKPLEIDMALVEQIRSIFLEPKVNTELPEIKWNPANPDKIKEILCEKHDFNKERVESAMVKLMAKGGTKTQKRLDMFFK